jgi:hypothetical protein
MLTRTDETQNRDDNYRPPKHSAARILWKMPLDEWKAYQAGEITARQLKERYGAGGSGGEQQ